jgi:dimethylargininase
VTPATSRDVDDPPPRLIVRRPAPDLDDGELTHLERVPVDADLAADQWRRYVEVFRRAGWEIVELPPLPDHPDGAFVEDTVFMYGDLAVIARPGAASRRGEVATTAAALRELGYDTAEIAAPGTLEGGDIIKYRSTVWVGESARTNAKGIAQLRAALEPRGATVISVPVSKVLHLKSAATALTDGTIVVHRPLLDDLDGFERVLEVDEESGAHVVGLGGGRLLVATSAPRTAARLTDLGYDVETTDVSEFEKMEACVTCLSVRLRTPPS